MDKRNPSGPHLELIEGGRSKKTDDNQSAAGPEPLMGREPRAGRSSPSAADAKPLRERILDLVRGQQVDYHSGAIQDLQEWVKQLTGVVIGDQGAEVLLCRRKEIEEGRADDFGQLEQMRPDLATFFEEEKRILSGRQYAYIEIELWDAERGSRSLGRFASNRVTANLKHGHGVRINGNIYRVNGFGFGGGNKYGKFIVATPALYRTISDGAVKNSTLFHVIKPYPELDTIDFDRYRLPEIVRE